MNDSRCHCQYGGSSRSRSRRRAPRTNACTHATHTAQRTHPQQAAVVDGRLGAEEHVEEQLQEGRAVLRRHEAVCWWLGGGGGVVGVWSVRWALWLDPHAEAEAEACNKDMTD